jgi:hypothetical protein
MDRISPIRGGPLASSRGSGPAPRVHLAHTPPTLDAGVDRARRLSQCFWSWVVDVEVDVEEEEALGAKDAAMIGRR